MTGIGKIRKGERTLENGEDESVAQIGRDRNDGETAALFERSEKAAEASGET